MVTWVPSAKFCKFGLFTGRKAEIWYWCFTIFWGVHWIEKELWTNGKSGETDQMRKLSWLISKDFFMWVIQTKISIYNTFFKNTYITMNWKLHTLTLISKLIVEENKTAKAIVSELIIIVFKRVLWPAQNW